MFFSKRRKKKDAAADAAASLESELDKTVCLDDKDQLPISIGERAKFTIKLTELNPSGRSWTFPMISELLIGRGPHCPIQFSDKSVSREQCKISIQNDQLFVVQIGMTNNTLLNGAIVRDSAPLRAGDVLKFGRGALRVDQIQALESQDQKLNKLLSAVDIDEDKTVSFF